MGITVRQSDESTSIVLEGVIDIASAAELKTTLIEALKPSKPAKAVRVTLDANADLDITAIQLLWAAEREARAASVELILEGQVPESVSAAMREAGLERFPISV